VIVETMTYIDAKLSGFLTLIHMHIYIMMSNFQLKLSSRDSKSHPLHDQPLLAPERLFTVAFLVIVYVRSC
jgi:hypothetical protein